MTTLTIQSLGDTRSWEGKYGAACAIPVHFTDGSQAQYQTKPDAEAKRRVELQACVGVPGEFVLEDGGKWDDGNPKPMKLKDYPGKPSGNQDGGSAKSSWYNSEEGVRFTQERTDRRTALMQAVAQAGWNKTIANQMYEWLRATTPPGDSAAGTGVIAPPVSNTSEVAERSRDKTAARGATSDWGAEPNAASEHAAASSGGPAVGTADKPPEVWSHQSNVDRKPNGDALPKGFIRCETCGFTRKAAA